MIAGRKTLFGMMGVFAEFERSMIQERVKGRIKRLEPAGNAGDDARLSKQILTFAAKCFRFGNKDLAWEGSARRLD